MGLQIERIPTLGDNYTYLVICDQTREAAIIDAPESDPVIACVEAAGAKVTKILSTHHHADHSQANPELARRFKVPVYGHASDATRLPGFTTGIEDGDIVEVGHERARVLFIPCHTSGHVAYVFDDARASFTGDMLFAGGCGRTFEGDAAQLYHALCEKLAALPDDMRVFCGHEYTQGNLEFAVTVEPENAAMRARLEQVRSIRGKAAGDWHQATAAEMTIPTTIGEERETNPFMRASDAEEMGRRRSLKDNF